MGYEPCIVLEAAADGIAHCFVLTHPFGNNVLCAHDGGINVRHLVSIDKLAGSFLNVAAALRHDDLGKRLQSQLTCCFGACLALGLIGQINVLECVGVPAVVDAVGEFWREFVLCLDGLQDGGAPFFQFPVVAQSLVDRLDREIVKVTCRFLAVTADERYGRAVIKQADGASHLVDGNVELLGNERREFVCHSWIKWIDWIIWIEGYFLFLRVMTVISGVAPMRMGVPTMPVPMLT